MTGLLYRVTTDRTLGSETLRCCQSLLNERDIALGQGFWSLRLREVGLLNSRCHLLGAYGISLGLAYLGHSEVLTNVSPRRATGLRSRLSPRGLSRNFSGVSFTDAGGSLRFPSGAPEGSATLSPRGVFTFLKASGMTRGRQNSHRPLLAPRRSPGNGLHRCWCWGDLHVPRSSFLYRGQRLPTASSWGPCLGLPLVGRVFLSHPDTTKNL